MSDSISSAMSTLKNSADKLNTITNKAASTVKNIEAFLSSECSIGFNERVLIKKNDFSSTYLEYRRVGSNFRITVTNSSNTNTILTKKETVKAWSDCSRDIKIESLEKLPDLIIAITKHVEKEITKADVARNTAMQVLNSLKGKEGE